MFTQCFAWLSNASPLPAIWVGRGRRSLLWWYLAACVVFDVLCYTLKHNHMPWHWVSNLFLVLEFVLVSWFLSRKILIRRAYTIMQYLLTGTALLYLVHTAYRSVESPNYAFGAAFYITMIILSVLGFFKVIREVEVVKIERSPLFVYCTAFLLYAAGCFVLLLFIPDVTSTNMTLMYHLWVFHNCINILKNIVIFFGFRLEAKS